jgi:hypothetical protein
MKNFLKGLLPKKQIQISRVETPSATIEVKKSGLFNQTRKVTFKNQNETTNIDLGEILSKALAKASR